MEQISISPKESYSNYIEQIIELFIYFKDNLNAPFLQNLTTSVPLTKFLLNILENREQYDKNFKFTRNKDILDNSISQFKMEYWDEIVISYDLVNDFLLSYKKSIPKHLWICFCYQNS